MKLSQRLLIAVYAGFLINSLLVFIWGDAGLKQIHTLRDHRDKLVNNIEKLEKIHNDLSLERDALLYDEMEIELRARALGYYRDDVIQVILSGQNEKAGSRTLGTLVRRAPASPGSGVTSRVIFICISIVVFAGTFFWRRHGRDSHAG